MEQWIPHWRTCFTLGCCQLPTVQPASPFQASLLWETPNCLFLTLIFSQIRTWYLGCGNAGGAQPQGAPAGLVLRTCKVAQKTRPLGGLHRAVQRDMKMQFWCLCFLASTLKVRMLDNKCAYELPSHCSRWACRKACKESTSSVFRAGLGLRPCIEQWGENKILNSCLFSKPSSSWPGRALHEDSFPLALAAGMSM